MPELPEVETIVRGLSGLIGLRVGRVDVRWERSIAAPDASAFASQMEGRRVLGVSRRGKWVVIGLDRRLYLLLHLRMSGRLTLSPPCTVEERYVRVILHLGDGRRLVFSDPRKLGRVVLTSDPERVLGKLGPEPLSEEFTAELLNERLKGRSARLKSLLLDQRFLAGLGNIYADEVLWRAGLHPLRRADSLTYAEVVRLHGAIRQVLREAISARGTTLPDGRYVDARGQAGEFVRRHAVYRQTGKPCPRCGSAIARIIVNGRGTHFCPRCQV